MNGDNDKIFRRSDISELGNLLKLATKAGAVKYGFVHQWNAFVASFGDCFILVVKDRPGYFLRLEDDMRRIIARTEHNRRWPELKAIYNEFAVRLNRQPKIRVDPRVEELAKFIIHWDMK